MNLTKKENVMKYSKRTNNLVATESPRFQAESYDDQFINNNIVKVVARCSLRKYYHIHDIECFSIMTLTATSHSTTGL